MHSFVMYTIIGDVKDNTKVIDHIDGNRLNNTISNLRVVSRQENSRNKNKAFQLQVNISVYHFKNELKMDHIMNRLAFFANNKNK